MIVAGRRLSILAAVGVAAVVLLGVLLRFAYLDRKVFWHDEVYTRIFAAGYQARDWQKEVYSGQPLEVARWQSLQRYNPAKGIVDTVMGLADDEPQHPPLYYALARVWAGVVGDSVSMLRLLSALLSLLAFPSIYWLGRELFKSTRVAWTAVMLLAVSPFFVLYAQEAREYALWSALILVATAALLRALRLSEESERLSPRLVVAWGLFAVLTALGFYTCFSTATVLLAQGIYVLVRERLRLTRATLMALGAAAVALLLFAPWAVMLLRHFEAFQTSMAWSKTIVIPRSELLQLQALNASRTVLDFADGLDSIWVSVAVGLSDILFVGALVFVCRRATLRASALLVCLIAVPIGFLLLPDLALGGIRSLSARYVVPAWLALELCLAFLFTRAGGDGRSTAARLGLLATLALSIASCALSATKDAVWTKGVSVSLPRVAAAINAYPAPLVVGNREVHNPGNLLALSNMLRPSARMQVVEVTEPYLLPQGYADVFLFGPTKEFREELEAREHVRARLVVKDLYVQLWKIELVEEP